MNRLSPFPNLHGAAMACTEIKTVRRGMLLLLVLLMLALFLGAGAILLTVAARARAAARAAAGVSQQSLLGDSLARDALDKALMAVLRGAVSGTNGSVTVNGNLECILQDKYGDPIICSGSLPLGSSGPLLPISLSGPGVPSQAARLNGRVLTIRPEPGDGEISSYRVLAATGTSALILAPPTAIQRPLPTRSFEVIVNGREFTPAANGLPESYDAFDDANKWLAQPVLRSGQIFYIGRSSFAGDVDLEDNAGVPIPGAVDNDGDSVLDGVWISGTGGSLVTGTVIPSQPSPLGGTISFRVSYLILDLDGRVNINAAGIAAPPGGAYDPPVQLPDSPLGMGYGPADIDASLLFPRTLPADDGLSPYIRGTAATGIWAILSQGGTPSAPIPSSATQRRRPPIVGAIQGRYGRDGRPGMAGDDTDANQRSAPTGDRNYQTTVAGTNAVADLQGRLKVYMSGSTMTFFRPIAAVDGLDDPYEMRLDGDARRTGAIRSGSAATTVSDDSPYTFGELEPVLRPYDTDAQQLPQRLAAVLGDQAQQARSIITTDSWTAPVLSGTAGRRIEDFMAALPVITGSAAWTSGSIPLSPDTAIGLKFDINRSGSTSAQAQEYCKGLFTLAVALGATGTAAAQWAANVNDFRDADSVFTRFEYDPNPSDGWSPPSGSVVWGTERPELVINALTSIGGNVSVVLRHPARSVELKTGNTPGVATETIDPALGQAPNTLVFRQNPKIWRVLLQDTVDGAITTLDTRELADDSQLTPGQTRTVNLTGSSLTAAAKVVLERLSSPAQPFDATSNPYVAVDEQPVNGNVAPVVAQWVHWPNRPFISNAELALVPATRFIHRMDYPGSGMTSTPDESLVLQQPLLLDATYVPSRFAGNSLTVSGSLVSSVGLDKLPLDQVSRWREPGRINVNTVLTGTNAATCNLDNVVWSLLVADTTINNAFVGRPRIRTTPAMPNPGQGMPAIPATPGQRAVPAIAAKSLAHLLSMRIEENPIRRIQTGSWGDADSAGVNPYFLYARAIRLASTATVRSNVFAIWVTVEMRDDSPDAPSPVTRRLFAIIDRSIPVGYQPNRDLNVRDCVLLSRYLD